MVSETEIETEHRFVATCPKGVEALLASELESLGVSTEIGRGAVRFGETMEHAYLACLGSRVASRVLLPLASFEATTPEELYEGVRSVRFSEHMGPNDTFALRLAGRTADAGSPRFLVLKAKDALVDQIRDETGQRPNVDADNPDIALHLHVRGAHVDLSLDLSGRPLHERGYRRAGGAAPLKENLAAAILMLAGWPEMAREGGTLFDPMCGSATLLIEGAMMAGGRAPNIDRRRWGFSTWRGHDAAEFEAAKRTLEAKATEVPTVYGADQDAEQLFAAKKAIEGAGLSGKVLLKQSRLREASPPKGLSSGVVVVNPPYGERLGDSRELIPLYARLGDVLKQRFGGWQAAVLSASPSLASSVGLKPSRKHPLFNGPIECRLLTYELRAAQGDGGKRRSLRPEAKMFANRLKKNAKKLASWVRDERLEAYRVYDADIPEYNLSVDRYGDKVFVQEYGRSSNVSERAADARVRDALEVVSDVLEVDRDAVAFRVRSRVAGGQRERRGEGDEFVVKEGAHQFYVNLERHFDTGLYLDHRKVRQRVARLAKGKRFLNLFAYTGTATVHAARGGASRSLSVDLSRTYCEWAERNFELNGLSHAHRVVRSDCLEWLRRADEQFDLILLAPPTFSRSKSMNQELDLVRDHVPLLRDCLRLLSRGGVLLFSTHAKRFDLDMRGLGDVQVDEITRKTTSRDFVRYRNAHRTFELKK